MQLQVNLLNGARRWVPIDQAETSDVSVGQSFKWESGLREQSHWVPKVWGDNSPAEGKKMRRDSSRVHVVNALATDKAQQQYVAWWKGTQETPALEIKARALRQQI